MQVERVVCDSASRLPRRTGSQTVKLYFSNNSDNNHVPST